jgi:hypothetical protein
LDGKVEKRTFATRDEADAWRQQQMALRDKGIRPLREETLGWWLDHCVIRSLETGGPATGG